MNERLKALEMINGKNMEADAEVATARVKMYIADPKKLIMYTDLFENITDQVLRDVKSLVYGSQYPDAPLFEQAMAENINALSTLLPMSIVATRWAVKEHHHALVDSLSAIANRIIEKPNTYYKPTLKLNRLLDTTYLYGVGLACVFYKKFGLLDLLFKVKFDEYDHYFSPYIIDQDNCWIVSNQDWNNSTNYSRSYSPFSTTLANLLRPYFAIIRDDNEYFSIFCIFEKLLAMYFYMLIGKDSKYVAMPPIGSFCWRPRLIERSGNSMYKDFFDAVEKNGENALLIKDGMFDGSYQNYKDAFDAVTDAEPKAMASMY